MILNGCEKAMKRLEIDQEPSLAPGNPRSIDVSSAMSSCGELHALDEVGSRELHQRRSMSRLPQELLRARFHAFSWLLKLIGSYI